MVRGLALGLHVRPELGRRRAEGTADWLQIQQVDKRVSNSGRGAVIGALALGALSALAAGRH
jgi:hypothetical protein